MSNEQKTIDQLLSTGRELAAKDPRSFVTRVAHRDWLEQCRTLIPALADALEAAEARAKAAEDGWDRNRDGRAENARIVAAGVQQKRAEEFKADCDALRTRLAAVEAERDAHAADAIRLAGTVAQLEAVVKAARGIAVLPDNTFAGGGVYRIPPEALAALDAADGGTKEAGK